DLLERCVDVRGVDALNSAVEGRARSVLAGDQAQDVVAHGLARGWAARLFVTTQAAGCLRVKQVVGTQLGRGVLELDVPVVHGKGHALDDVPDEAGAPRGPFLFLEPRVAGDRGLRLVDRAIAGNVAVRRGAWDRVAIVVGRLTQTLAGAARVNVQNGRERSRAFGIHQLHVRRLETGGIRAAHEQAAEGAPFQADVVGHRVVDLGDVIVLVVACGEARGDALEQRDAALRTHSIPVALAVGASGTGEVVDGLVVARTQRIGPGAAFEQGPLSHAFDHASEADGTCRKFEQVARHAEVQRRRRGFRDVLHAGRERPVDVRRDRVGVAIQVQFVYRIAREEALLIAQEVIVHSLGEQARTVRGVVVTGVRGEGF